MLGFGFTSKPPYAPTKTMLLAGPTPNPKPETRKCWGLGGLCWPISGLDMALKYGRSLGDHRATDALIDDISAR